MSGFPDNSPQGVLVLGAGPTGLTLANALAAYGTPVQIVDRKAEPSRDSKALALNVASQYGFELLGLGEALGKSGCRLHGVTVFWKGRRLSVINMRRLDFHLRSFIAQPQSETETELVGAFEAQGGKVHWQTRALSVVQHNDSVTVLFEDQERRRQARRYAYVVGCDGKNSLLRPQISDVFSGSDYPVYFVVGDYVLNWERPRDQGYYYVYEETFFIILPVGKNLWRVVVRHDGTLPVDTPLRSAEITDIVTCYLGRDIFVGDPVWISRAPFYMRVSGGLRNGRLFLAGDSAHLFSPIGGTGMNTGMQDALNLGWKLSYRLRGYAREALLDTFEAERLEAIRATAQVTDKSTRLITRIDRDPAAIMPMMPFMRNRTAFRTVLPLVHSGLGASSTQTLAAHGGSPLAGSRRAGELCLGLGGLLGLARRQGGPALVTIIARMDANPYPAAVQELQQLTADYSAALQTLVLLSTEDIFRQQSAPFPSLHFITAGSDLLRRTGVALGGLLLVFPNGLIGYSGALTDLQGLRSLLEAYFIKQVSVPLLRQTSKAAGATVLGP